MVTYIQWGFVSVSFADPELVQDLYVKRNEFLDKTGALEIVFKKLMGKSFQYSKADADWSAKRKACGHAFYKEKL